ncbi:toll-like receptor 13 [Acanthochromis polyacanthus]|uniref:toll-like receptor 13 n=1 Tax=Acanthochromis polyacanthus TaxID=80966 RepID=UPI0022347A6D|nr:toll-like receptor 13 [Acanthochromis polyacanthus]
MPTMGGLIVFLVSLLQLINASLAYSLKNCSIDYFDDPLADVFVNCLRRKLVTVPDDIPRAAVSVLLSNNHLEKINRGDFKCMSKLRVLQLADNHIAHVDGGSFIDLVVLRKLYMDQNKLTNLSASIFQGLSNLTILSLTSNKIEFIHPLAFRFLTSLQTLLLDSNSLRQITDIHPVLQLPHLQNLTIGDNLFSSFQTKDLPLNMSSGLQMLDVSSKHLQKFSITTPIFPQIQVIIFFRCANNLTWDIPDKTLLRSITQLYFNAPGMSFVKIQKVLQSLDSLMHLKLSYVTRWIQKGLLAKICKIPKLRKLDLSYNHLHNFTVNLTACSQLCELDLTNTYLTKLPKGSIESMKRLTSLAAGTNRFTKVPDDVKSLYSLEILDLSNNLIFDLSCEDFLNTTRLMKLCLVNNRIAKLQGCVFEHLSDLKVLDLSNNLLWTFGGTFKTGLQKLEFLDLSKNSLTNLQKGDFQGLQSLKCLNVTSDHINRVKHDTFDGLNNLETLLLSLPLYYESNFKGLRHLKNLTIYFKISDSFQSPPLAWYNETLFHLPSLKVFKVVCSGDHYGLPFDVHTDMFKTMRHLEDFTAMNVYISAPDPGTFWDNPWLKSLKLGMTDLSNLDPGMFDPITNLQTLDLSETKLKSLDFLAQANLTTLRSLKLSDNKIMVINETVFQSLPALTYLDLNNNPFTCDCSNAGFIQWVKINNQTQVVNAHQYRCSFPVAKQGNMLLDFDIQTCRTDINFLCFISSTCLVLLTLLMSFTYHFLRWQLVYAVHLFLAFLYDSRKRKKGDSHHYDAFVSYNIHNEDWVFQEMLPVLEGEQGWRLCLHHRDFQPGKPIIENITDAIYGSRKTICVISRRYLQSEWCSREIQMASFRLFDEKKDVLILLFLEDIPAWQLSPYYRMRKLVKRRTYLSWPQAGQHPKVFWHNVQRALETEDTPAENTNLLTGPAEL